MSGIFVNKCAVCGQLLREGKVSVRALETGDKWFGVTYAEDRPLVEEGIKALIESGVYEEDLYSDLDRKSVV